MIDFKKVNEHHIELMHQISLICCSSGPDSIFLTETIAKLSNQKHHLVYFNHQLRPHEIKKEIEIISNLSKKHSYHCHIIDLEICTKNQQEFRKERLEKIHHLCKKLHIKNVFLGHHLDDDIETLVMQLFRGATTSFRGISEITNYNDIQLIHPLLKFTKNEITNYLEEQNIRYAIDSSNNKLDYDRNKIRMLISSFNKTFSTSKKSIMNTIEYLKENEKKVINEMLGLKIHSINNSVWIQKKELSNPFNTITNLKVLLEKQFDQHINIEEQKILKASLTKKKQTSIKLKSITIDIDYKWVVIKEIKNEKELKQNLEQNKQMKLLNGYLCCTNFEEIKTSTKERLLVTNKQLRNLTVTTISKCKFKIPAQKKRLREQGISPIEQTIYPIIHDEKEVLWVPNVFSKKEKGNNCITFYNKFA